MEYEWKLKTKAGQPAIGYQLVYETVAKNIPILVTIYCFPKLNEFGDNKIASTVIFWNCKKSGITDGFIHWVMDDIGELIKENEKNLFDSELKNIELIMSQQFFCEKLPEIEYFTHGDYFIGESK